MLEPSLTCATVGGVAAYGICGGAGSRSRARARRRHHLRPSLTSGEAEICARGRAQRQVRWRFAPKGWSASLVVLDVPSGGWQAACVDSGRSVIMLLRLDVTTALLVTLLLCLYVG
jgi:hypothetical protein